MFDNCSIRPVDQLEKQFEDKKEIVHKIFSSYSISTSRMATLELENPMIMIPALFTTVKRISCFQPSHLKQVPLDLDRRFLHHLDHHPLKLLYQMNKVLLSLRR